MSTLSQKVALNATALGAGRLLLAAVGVVSVGVSARYLGVDDFGALVTATAFLALVVGLTDLGLATIGVRELAKRPGETKRIVGSLLVLVFGLSTAGLVLGMLLMLLIFAGDDQAHLREGIALLLLMSWPLTAPAAVIGCYFTAQQKAYLGTLASVVGAVLTVGLLIVVIQLDGGFLGIVVAYGATGIGYGLTMLMLSIGRIRLRPSLDLAHAWQLLRWAAPLGAAVLMGSIYWNIDIILLSHLGDHADVALYGVAVKVVGILLLLPGYVMITLLPEFARVAERRERLDEVMGKAFAVVQVGAIPLLVLSVVFADEIVQTVGGQTYAGSAALLRILMIGVALAYVSVVIAQGIIALNGQKQLFYGALIILPVNIALNLALIPIWGARGSAIAFVASEVASLATWLFVYSRMATLPRIYRFWALVVAGGATASVGLVKLLPFATATNAPLVLALGGLVGLGVYAGALYALKAMPREVHTAIVLPLWTKLKLRPLRRS